MGLVGCVGDFSGSSAALDKQPLLEADAEALARRHANNHVTTYLNPFFLWSLPSPVKGLPVLADSSSKCPCLVLELAAGAPVYLTIILGCPHLS